MAEKVRLNKVIDLLQRGQPVFSYGTVMNGNFDELMAISRADYDMAISQAFADNKGTPELDPWWLIEGLADKPVLIVRGETSDLLSAQTASRMLAKLPKAELVTVPGLGHAPILEEPEAAAGIDRLLEKVLAEDAISRPSAA